MSSVIAIVIYCVLLVALAVAVLLVIGRVRQALWRWRNPPEKLAAARRAFEERLLQPDWSFYERHLQRPAPSGLRELFADHHLVLADGCEYDELHYISTFEPLDERALVDARE